jgi:hypothetical protein
MKLLLDIVAASEQLTFDNAISHNKLGLCVQNLAGEKMGS